MINNKMQFLPSISVCNFTKTEIRTRLTTKSLKKNSPQEFVINKLEPDCKKSLPIVYKIEPRFFLKN